MAMINPEPFERIRTSRSQTKVANSVILENETALKMSHMALQIEHLKAQLETKSRRTGELEEQLQIKDKEIMCMNNEYETLTEKLKKI
jgi:chromosome segregation ATPase